MARFRKLELRAWADERMRSLTPPPPNARDLWLSLIVGPCTTQIPGIVIATPARLADSLGWGSVEQREAFDKALAEVLIKMPVQADTKAGLLWLQNGPKYNKPQNPNVITGWAETWALIPECNLKQIALCGLFEYAKAWGRAYYEALGIIAALTPENSRDQEQEAGSRSRKQEMITTAEVEAAGQLSLTPKNGNGKLAFKVEEGLALLAEASSGRFKATNPGGRAVKIQEAIQHNPDLAEWRLVGEWLGAGGEAYRKELDSRHVNVATFCAWLAHALDWQNGGRKSLDVTRPTRRDTRMPVRNDR